MISESTIEKLYRESNLSDSGLLDLIKTSEYDKILHETADKKRRELYGNDVYIRALIEFTNYCKNDCYYCGIRRSNREAIRYRLTMDEIMASCAAGYEQGFRTFVLQGGEDKYFTDERICDVVSQIRYRYPDCAITLSIGEKSRDSYQAFFDAGANRYLLRHETASDFHYKKLHPKEMRLDNRKRCLFDLKEIGYQVGAGFMVGSPFQEPRHILADLRFLQELNPDMIGIGPFVSQKNTPFGQGNYKNGSVELTLRLIAILRLLFPAALIPATTALGTIHPQGRELGIKAGANVVMPNFTPPEAKRKYLLYDNKICIAEDLKMCRLDTEKRMNSIGYKVVVGVGDPVRI